jgi:hypothetical protein
MSNDNLYVRDMIWGGVWGGLALLLPFLFHPFGLGTVLMPMFLPILIAGCTLHLRVSVVLALALPLISSLLTGMPPLYPVALIMMAEGVSMVVWLYWSYRRKRFNIYFCLIVAFLIQRAMMLLYGFIGREALLTTLVFSLPGAAAQVILIPWVLKILPKSGYAGERTDL